MHDLPEDQECNKLKDPAYRAQFHKLVFSSNWQQNDFVNKLGLVRDENMLVLETPITPIEVHDKAFHNQANPDRINLVYFSTPQRGLELLVPVFEELAKNNPNVHLHVHSSFLIYGWKEVDDQFTQLYDRIKAHPQMTYYGNTSQDELREALKTYHVLAYPCVWPETSCRVLMESMSAGILCVHPNLAALADTGGGLTSMYQYIDDRNKHANMFYQFLEHTVRVIDNDDIKNYLRFVKAYADNRFQLPKLTAQWDHTLRDLLGKYPTVESRAFPKKQFVYKTS